MSCFNDSLKVHSRGSITLEWSEKGRNGYPVPHTWGQVTHYSKGDYILVPITILYSNVIVEL